MERPQRSDNSTSDERYRIHCCEMSGNEATQSEYVSQQRGWYLCLVCQSAKTASYNRRSVMTLRYQAGLRRQSANQQMKVNYTDVRDDSNLRNLQPLENKKSAKNKSFYFSQCANAQSQHTNDLYVFHLFSCLNLPVFDDAKLHQPICDACSGNAHQTDTSAMKKKQHKLYTHTTNRYGQHSHKLEIC